MLFITIVFTSFKVERKSIYNYLNYLRLDKKIRPLHRCFKELLICMYIYSFFSPINNMYNIQISETPRCNHLLKLRYLFSSKLSSISSVMTNFVFGLRISSLFFCSASVSSARFSGRTIIFRGS